MSRLDELDLSSPAGAAKAQPSAVLLDVAPAAAEPDLPLREGEVLVDLPLRAGREAAAASAPALPVAPRAERVGMAPLSSRGTALAADAALVLLLTAAPLLAATALPGSGLAARGLWGTALFTIYLFFFATVVPLILFGKTVGMALTGLTARAPLTAAEASRRWIGTALTLAGAGIPLLATRRRHDSPSPADRLSGRTLFFEEPDRS